MDVLKLLHEASFCFLQTKEHQRCLQTCDKVLAWNGKDIISLVYKSDALLQTHQITQAIQCLVSAHDAISAANKSLNINIHTLRVSANCRELSCLITIIFIVSLIE